MSSPSESLTAMEPELLTPNGPTSTDARADRLASRIRRLRTRAGSGTLDRWLLVVGGVLLPLGLLLVILGWLGASRTPLLFEQTPYLISGGLLGTCLVFCGGFVYFAYWQTVQVRDGRTQHAELLRVLERMENLMAVGAPGSPGIAPAAENGSAGSRLVATEKGTLFHRADCQVVAGKDNLRVVRADDPALRPCQICQPVALTV